MQKRAPNLPVSAAAVLLAAAWLAAPAWTQEADTSAGAAQAAAAEEAGAPDTAGKNPNGQAQSAAQPGAKGGKAGPKAGKGGKAAPAEQPPEDGGPLVLGDGPDDSVLDDQTYGGEDDDFIPSEEIPVDEPIPYPTDI